MVFYPRWMQSLDFPKKNGLADKIWGKHLEKRGICTLRTGSGLDWKMDLRNPTHRWAFYGLYDPEFLNWAKKFLPADGIVIDSGANIGQTVMYLGQYVGRGKLLAFEPGRSQLLWLRGCVEANRAALPGVELIEAGLGENEQRGYLHDSWVSEKFHGASSHVSKETGEPIHIVSLTQALRARGIEHVDLWKLDVEGYELEALKGAEALLREKKIAALYIELYRQDGQEYWKHGVAVREYLGRFGYSCHVFKGFFPRLVKEGAASLAANGIFLPNG